MFTSIEGKGNNPLRVNNSDVYNPLKTITVLLYRTTDQGLGIFK
jgi:hypothetical protein